LVLQFKSKYFFGAQETKNFFAFKNKNIAKPKQQWSAYKNRWYIGTCQIPVGYSNPNDKFGLAKSSLGFGWPKTYHNLFKSHSLPVPTVKFKFHFFIIHTFPLTGKQHKIKKINSHITHSNNAKLNDIYIIRMREEAENLNIFSKNIKKNQIKQWFVLLRVLQCCTAIIILCNNRIYHTLQ
jgi:hypothetical protein